MREIARILCPVDFSDASRHAIDHAVVMAQWYEAAIVALHVHDPVYVGVAGLDLPDYQIAARADAGVARRVRAELETAFLPAVTAGVTVEMLVEEGSPAIRILEGVRAHGADLIVMGTHGTSGFERLLLGSVTEKVVRKATCPVLTVPPRAHATSRLPFRRVLCPVDFSQASIQALGVALSIAQEAQADLHLVHVLEWPVDQEPPALPSFNVPAYRVYREKEAAVELERLIPAEARAWCQPGIRLLHGKPYEQILALAGEQAIDLIVIGVHGRNALDLMLFGSTTNQVIRGATCPVLTIRGG
jgi:nucleotide-binding universal stress UspA family protein